MIKSPIAGRWAVLLLLSAVGMSALAGHMPQLLGAYVLLADSGAGETVALARVIVDGADSACPSLIAVDGEGELLAMTPRRNPQRKHFPIQVCEAIYPSGEGMRILGYTTVLPELSGAVGRVTVFGDTGCKPSDQHGCHQHSSHHWPLREMADAAAAAAPDLILHMGDYNYRGTPGKIHVHAKGKKLRVYDAGDNTASVTCKLSGPYVGQNSVGSDSPDRWDNWYRDFFEPMGKLLSTAPWVFARGNHELCSRAGPGWFYLLDPGSDLLGDGQGQLACPAAESHEPLLFRRPYRVDLAGLSVVVLDSANACDQGDLHQGHFDRQFKLIQGLVAAAPGQGALWLQSHRPIWGVKKPEDAGESTKTKPSDYGFIDQTLQTAYARYPVPQPLHLVLSGHMHRFQSISFAGAEQGRRPSQLIIGNGGVALAGNFPKRPFVTGIDGMQAQGFGVSKFGYMDIRLQAGGAWTGELLGDEGQSLAVCNSGDWSATGVCSPGGG